MNDKEKFAEGIIAKKPNSKAPHFVIAQVGINIGNFIAWADKHTKKGWVNITIKESKNGRFYAQIDAFEPHIHTFKEELKTAEPIK